MKILYLVLIIVFFQMACNPNNEGKLPPPAEVLMVDKFTDLGVIEHGIDAVPEKDGIYIEWYLLQDPDVTSYNIYRKSKNELIFSRLTSIPVENIISPFDTVFSYIDSANIILDTSEFVYYYYVTASNRDGVEGPVPDSLLKHRYMLNMKPETQNINNINSGEQPVFSWDFLSEPVPYYFIIRIENEVADTLVWTRRFVNSELDRAIDFDLSTVSNPPLFQSGSIYRWRIERVGPDSLYSGSESKWKTFSVN